MFKLLRNKRTIPFFSLAQQKLMHPCYLRLLVGKTGQSIIVQYVVTFFLVVAFITAMSTYVQRLFQGRIHDARDYVVLTANRIYAEAPGLNLQGNGIRYEYEPYYSNQESAVYSSSDELRQNIPTLANQSGIYQYDQDQTTKVGSFSNQAAPGNAD